MRDRGFILISTLMVLTLASVIASQLTNSTYSLLRLFQEKLHQKSAYERALLSGERNVERLSENLSLVYQKGEAGRVKRRVAILTFEPRLSPLIDYNEIFSKMTPCLDQTYNDNKLSTDTGRSLSSGSYRSSKTCAIAEPLTDDLVISGNIEMLNDITLDDTKGEYLIAATGYINIPKSITTSRPLTIIAGGDIFVDEIIAQETQNFSYLSSSGAIISKTSQNILISGYAREGNYIVSTMPLEPFQSTLKRKKMILGIQP